MFQNIGIAGYAVRIRDCHKKSAMVGHPNLNKNSNKMIKGYILKTVVINNLIFWLKVYILYFQILQKF